MESEAVNDVLIVLFIGGVFVGGYWFGYWHGRWTVLQEQIEKLTHSKPDK